MMNSYAYSKAVPLKNLEYMDCGAHIYSETDVNVEVGAAPGVFTLTQILAHAPPPPSPPIYGTEYRK
jgi:hypothetical protein